MIARLVAATDIALATLPFVRRRFRYADFEPVPALLVQQFHDCPEHGTQLVSVLEPTCGHCTT